MRQQFERPERRAHIASFVISLALLGLACSGPHVAVGSGVPPVPNDSSGPAPGDREAERLLRRARSEYSAADYAATNSLSDSLVATFPRSKWVAPALLVGAYASFELSAYEEATLKLERYLRYYRASDPARTPGLLLIARILHSGGRPTEAADTLLATPVPLGERREEAADLARQVAADLGAGEIETVTARWPADHPLRSVFEVERATLLLSARESERARDLASEALSLEILDADRERAERIVSGLAEEEQWHPIIGAILPLSGPLARFGQLAEEGIRLAVREYNDRYADSVTLVVRDDRDDLRLAGELARELDRMGAVAVVGPLRTDGLQEAARGRRDRNMLIVSPTASENVRFGRNVYSLFGTTERVARSARTLAEFAIRDLQIYRFGVLYPSNAEGRTQLAAFSDAVRAWGGEITASVAYDDSATTFQAPLEFLEQAHPQAIFAPAPTPQTVIQLAPQFSFYGLRGVQLLGDEEWSDPRVLRLVEPRFVDGTVVVTFLDRSSPAVRWPEFVEQYERTYRKGLGDNLVPALAYDATSLLLAALPWGYPRRSAVARSFREIHAVPGATGVFYILDGVLQRRPFVLHVKDRNLLPAYGDVQVGAARDGDGR